MLACFLNRENRAALVLTALAACTMGKLALVAVRALGEAGRGQEVVAAALGSPLFGVAPFWIRHCSIPFESASSSSAHHAPVTNDEAKN
jgi:ABC-type cobalamin transport system permease subunit